ncbi:MAG: VCBS domain-containing protein, partial [Shewanella sp.]
GTLTEDSVGSAAQVSGNVLVNNDGTDVFGADGRNTNPDLEPGSGLGVMDWTPTSAQLTALANYGTLTLSENGGYTFVLDNTKAAVQALKEGESKTFTLDYVVRDGDGDVSNTAQLTLSIVGKDECQLIVGDNGDDRGNDATPDLVGQANNDVLIGDKGGTSKLEGQKANIEFVLDNSGSMSQSINFTNAAGITTQISRLAAMKLAVNNAIDKLGTSGAQDVRIHIDMFATKANSSSATFALIAGGMMSTKAIADAKAFVNGIAIATEQFTNYEAGLLAANKWIDDLSGPVANADVNKVIFVSDGEPNRAIDSNNNVITVNVSTAIGHVLGTLGTTDNSNEVSLIETKNGSEQAFTIESVGIAVTNTAVDLLSQVEGSRGQADNITNANALNTVIGQLTGSSTVVNAVGDDTLRGEAGNDLMFGDSIYVDANNSGWGAFKAANPGLSDQQLIDKLTADHVNYGRSGSVGGGDVLDGGSGNDILYGQKGNDTLMGGLGNDILTGGSDSDRFIWRLADLDGSVDKITDFSLGQNGDVLDISDLLAPANPTLGEIDSLLTFDKSAKALTIDLEPATADKINSVTIQFHATIDFTGANDTEIITKLIADGNLKVTDN